MLLVVNVMFVSQKFQAALMFTLLQIMRRPGIFVRSQISRKQRFILKIILF